MKYERYEMERLLSHCDIPPGMQKNIDYLDNSVFSPSKVYEHAIGVLDINHCITIIGPPGSGKTLTALQLARRKCGKGGKTKLYFCQNLDEISDKADANHNTYIVMDDWIDHYVYYPSTLQEAVKCLDQIYGDFVKSGNVHLILTAQEDKWKKFSDVLKDCCVFDSQRLVKLDFKKTSKKQLKEKQNIILCHFQYFDIEENSEKIKNQAKDEKITAQQRRECFEKKDEQKQTDDENEMLKILENCTVNDQNGEKMTVVEKGSIEKLAKKLKQEDAFSFPIMIDLICRNERLMKAKDLIFKDGFTDILNVFFENWSNDTNVNEKRSFCVLVFAALLGERISVTDFSSQLTGPLYKRICSEHDHYLKEVGEKGKQKHKTENSIENIEPDSEEKLLMNNCRLKSCLYRISRGHGNTSFVFQHNSLLRFILSFVMKMKDENFLIENANFEILLNMCWLDNTLLDKLTMKSIPEGSICISVNSYKPLAKRIHLETLQGYRIPQWQNHAFMSHKTFREVWAKELENNHKDVENVAN